MSDRAVTIALAVAAGLGAIALGAYLSWPSDPVQRVTIDDPREHWQREGFVEMVPPVRLPSSTADADDVAIWLKLPEGGVIETRWSEARDGWVLAFPAGTVADRVEQRGKGDKRGVVDVRGARLTDDGEELMHTLRRTRPGADAPLFGYEWPRSDPDAHARATERLLDELGKLEPASGLGGEARERYLDNIRRKNACLDCHVHERPDNAVEGEHGLVNRGTDGSGWFTPQTVLLDAIVLERYGGVDPNLDDPAITIECPDGESPKRTKKGTRVRASCSGAAVPIARVDYSALDSARLSSVCRARRYLFEHLDAQGQQVFAAALEPCD